MGNYSFPNKSNSSRLGGLKLETEWNWL